MQGWGKLDSTDIVYLSNSSYMSMCLIRNFYEGQFRKIKSPEWSRKCISVRHMNRLFFFFLYFNWMFSKHYIFYALVTKLSSGEWCSYSFFLCMFSSHCGCELQSLPASNQESLIILKSDQWPSIKNILWLENFV